MLQSGSVGGAVPNAPSVTCAPFSGPGPPCTSIWADSFLGPRPLRQPRSDPEEVQEFCKERLASYKAPREVKFREDLPKTLTGKVVKKALKEELMQARGEGQSTAT